MQTVAELQSFRRAAVKAGMCEEDIGDLVSYLSDNPEAGDEIKNTGGCRKIRFAIRRNKKGKSGGVRIITFYSGEDMPVFLLTVFAKSVKIDLTANERKGLKTLTEKIVDEYSRRVVHLETERQNEQTHF